MPFTPIEMSTYFKAGTHTQYRPNHYLDKHIKHPDGPKLEFMRLYDCKQDVVDHRPYGPDTPTHSSYNETPETLWMNHLDQPKVNDQVALDYIDKKLADDDWGYMFDLCSRMAKSRIQNRVLYAKANRSRPSSPGRYLTPGMPEPAEYEENRRLESEKSEGQAGEQTVSIEDFMRSLGKEARQNVKEQQEEEKRRKEERKEEERKAKREEMKNEQIQKYEKAKKRQEWVRKQVQELQRKNEERKKHNYILARDCTGLVRWVIENEDVHIPEDLLYLEDCDYPDPVEGFQNPQTLFTTNLRPNGAFPCDNVRPDCVCFESQAEYRPKTVIFNTKNGRGLGLKALRDIKNGEYIGEFRGLISVHNNNETDPVKIGGLKTQDMRYAIGGHWDETTDFGFEDNGTTRSFSYYIDALREGTETRFINHHCDPDVVNCEYIEENHKGKMLTVVRATKFIKQGDEILLDYGAYDDWTAHEGHCLCGSAKCRFDPTKNYPPTYVRTIEYPGKGACRVTIRAAKPKYKPFVATARIERKKKKRTYHIWYERRPKANTESPAPAPGQWPADTYVHVHVNKPPVTPRKLKKTGLGYWSKLIGGRDVSRGRKLSRWTDVLREEEEEE
jgi:hypothetical protein